jgi:hypothetical protein
LPLSASPCHVEPPVFDLLVHLITHRDLLLRCRAVRREPTSRGGR